MLAIPRQVSSVPCSWRECMNTSNCTRQSPRSTEMESQKQHRGLTKPALTPRDGILSLQSESVSGKISWSVCVGVSAFSLSFVLLLLSSLLFFGSPITPCSCVWNCPPFVLFLSLSVCDQQCHTVLRGLDPIAYSPVSMFPGKSSSLPKGSLVLLTPNSFLSWLLLSSHVPWWSFSSLWHTV